MRNKLEYWRFKHALVVGILCCAGCVAGPVTPLANSPAPPATVHFPQKYNAQPAPFIIPAPAWVADSAGILSPETEDVLMADLQALEQRTGHQMVVVTVPSLGGKDVADAALLIGQCWAVGRKDHDDGTVLLVAPVERHLRISLGYGLEAYIPDARAKAIIDTDILPHFRKQAYDAGVKAGVAALIAELDQVPRDTRKAAGDAKSKDPITPDGGSCPAV